ncbi:MAG: rhomboid family intramembrane serine protease [Tannerella sp.]|jgi:membrane associated rhomboid family serine protease|nr:rhomboid family intramembrane serine protease [Tannerella sp.]
MRQNGFGLMPNMPPAVKNIIIINALMWLASVFMTRIDLSDMLGLHYPMAKNFHLYQVVSYMFMHASFAHIFFNMFAVYMFGNVLEQRWGSKRFLTYYMVTGIGAGLINLLVIYLRIRHIEMQLTPDLVEMVHSEGASVLAEGKNYTNPLLGNLNALINSSTVGASGAVFGILMAFGMMYPNVSMYIFPLPFPIKAKYMVLGYGAIELFLGFANFRSDNIAHFAHLGGMLFGVIMVLLWKKKNYNDGNYYY